MKLIGLEVEYIKDPVGIDSNTPRFSWKFRKSSRGQAQKVYQIIVSSSKSYLKKGDYDYWDSGKVILDINFNMLIVVKN